MSDRERKAVPCFVIEANALVAGRRYLLPPAELGPWHTVPWLPDAGGEQLSGRTLRAVRLTAKLAIETGWSAAALQARPQWHEASVPGALVRTAVRLGLIP
jgi:hypothetical protein